MGENPSARTERELVALRGHIESDVDRLKAKAKYDADLRHLVRRNPVAVLGTAGSLGTLALGFIARRGRGKLKPTQPIGDRAMDAGIAAASTALTNFAAQAARRFATRLFDDERS